jgi:UDP-N-acetyl-D-glucosamine dehydrogenase
LNELGAKLDVIDPFLEQVPHSLTNVSLVGQSSVSTIEYDAAVILTDHDEIDYALIAERIPYIFDARHRMKPGANVEYL